MTTRTYGLAYPLKYEEAKPGMLISAMYGARHVMGLTFTGDREMLLAVFADGAETDPRPPYVLELTDVHGSMTVIPGQREFEPADDQPFGLLPNRKIGGDGFVITSGGQVGLAVVHRDFGMPRFMVLNFDTGEPLERTGEIAMLPPIRLFVVEEGRKERREIIARPTS